MRIYGIHDEEGNGILESGDWIVTTEIVGEGLGKDYSFYKNRGLNVIARLNYGYGATGTIPTPDKYDEFSSRVQSFVGRSVGCTRWIIGNEPNHSQERPEGKPISSLSYVSCFLQCVQKIRNIQQAKHQVFTAAVAPWNVETGDWLDYFSEMLRAIPQGHLDGITLHTYTHGSDPGLVSSPSMMNPPYSDRHFNFLAYRDFMAQIPLSLRNLPIYITETDQDKEWRNSNSGWVKSAYSEIDLWNRTHAQKIFCLALYRWRTDDKWSFSEKNGVIEDLRDAMRRNYTVSAEEKDMDEKIYIPFVSTTETANWDPRLTRRGAKLIPYSVPNNSTAPFFKLISGYWLDEKESAGKHHIFVRVIDENGKNMAGQNIKVWWSSGSTIVKVKDAPEFAADFPMFSPAPGYSISVDSSPSDIVAGLGLGSIEQPSYAIHTSYQFTFQKVTQQAKKEPAPKEPVVIKNPPPAPTSDVVGDDALLVAFSKILRIPICMSKAIVKIESGGRFFGEDGRLTIRFEAHIFEEKAHSGLFTYDAERPWTKQFMRHSPFNGWTPMHTSPSAEYEALLIAEAVNPLLAYNALGMGAGQIMGFNSASVGYNSPKEMFDSFSSSSGKLFQLAAIFTYIDSLQELKEAARSCNFREFARLYNGTGQTEAYSALLKAEFEKCAQTS